MACRSWTLIEGTNTGLGHRMGVVISTTLTVSRLKPMDDGATGC